MIDRKCLMEVIEVIVFRHGDYVDGAWCGNERCVGANVADLCKMLVVRTARSQADSRVRQETRRKS